MSTTDDLAPRPVPATRHDQYRVDSERPIDLSEWDTSEKGGWEKAGAKEELKRVRDRLVELQPRLYAEGKRSVLVVFQAIDAGGKDGTIRNVLKGVNPQGVRVASFKQPSKEELAHDFLWRIHQETPACGMIRVFNRSHYEDVLVVRVKNLVPERVWRPRYRTINEFERGLALRGTAIVKIFLHISRDEQKERFQARLDEPDKNWKFSVGDLDERALWDDYQAAFAEMIHRCSTPYAPWYVIPADRKWYRNLIITQLLVDVLEGMNPQYPENEDDLTGIVIPD